MNIPAQMKALVIRGPLDMQIEQVPVPTLAPDQVLVRVAKVGICATDVELYDGRMPYIEQGLTKLPLIPGHEWSGTIVAVGSDAGDLKPGDRVVGDVSIGCGRCAKCLSGEYHLCDHRTELGIIGENGAFAEYLRTTARHVYRIPSDLSFEKAALAEPTATCLNALRRTGVQPGDRAAVFGTGVIGFLTAELSKAMGASSVVIVGRKPETANIAEQLGFQFVNSSSGDVVQEVSKRLGGLPEVVSECTGNPAALNDAIHLTAPGGRLNALSITGAPMIPTDIDHLVTRDIALIGSVASPNAFPPSIRLMSSGSLQLDPLISKVYAFDDVVEAFDYVRLRRGPRIKVMVSIGG